MGRKKAKREKKGSKPQMAKAAGVGERDMPAKRKIPKRKGK